MRRATRLMLVLLVAACGDGAISPDDIVIGPPVDESGYGAEHPVAGLVATPEQAEDLVAYLDTDELVLYVTDEAALVEGMAAGHWPELQWSPGAAMAVLAQQGQSQMVVAKQAVKQEVARKVPALNALRYRKSAHDISTTNPFFGGCFEVNVRYSGTGELSLKEVISATSLSGPAPDASAAIRTVYRSHKRLSGPGQTIRPEVYVTVGRYYHYDQLDCSSGYIGDTDLNRQWVIEMGVWPNP